MSNEAFQNINQLFSSFELFIKTVENPCHFSSNEEIKNCFKLAYFIEQTVVSFQTKNTINKWLDIMNNHFKEKNRNYKCYPVEVFSVACDYILNKFFEFSSTDVNMVDIAVRIYTSMLPKDRFQKFLSNLLVKAASYKAILDFVIINENSDSHTLEYKLKLNKWSKDFETAELEQFKSMITDRLKLSKVEKSLNVLIGVLTLENVSVVEESVRKIIMEIILNKMLDRSILSKSFWLALFKINTKDLLKICELSNDFLESLCNFLIYLGCMMEIVDKNGKKLWISNQNISICPEITYDDLLMWIKMLSHEDFCRRNYTINKIKQAEINTGSSLWTQILQEL